MCWLSKFILPDEVVMPASWIVVATCGHKGQSLVIGVRVTLITPPPPSPYHGTVAAMTKTYLMSGLIEKVPALFLLIFLRY
jgi:hypothetical protein